MTLPEMDAELRAEMEALVARVVARARQQVSELMTESWPGEINPPFPVGPHVTFELSLHDSPPDAPAVFAEPQPARGTTGKYLDWLSSAGIRSVSEQAGQFKHTDTARGAHD